MALIGESGAALRALSCLLLALAACCVSAKAQEVEASIEVVSLSPPRVKIRGRRAPATKWSFRNAHAGMLGLAERI